MRRSHTARSLLNAPPYEDQGSEAIFGFDFQTHCITRLCLEMASSDTVTEIICEYHEDVVQIRGEKAPCFCQIKKRESAGSWTIPLLKDAIAKLFEKLQFKDVGELVIYGHGRPSLDGEVSLGGLIALLDRPAEERDATWEADLCPYEQHLSKLLSPSIDGHTVSQGLRLMHVHLTMPHPDAIKSENTRRTAEVIRIIWGVDVTFSLAEQAYDALYKRVWEAHKRPKRPRTEKRITRQEARSIIRDVLRIAKLVTEDPQTLLDINTKLERGNLQDYVEYAVQKRMDARQVKFELAINSSEWQDFKDEIAVDWDDFQCKNVSLKGRLLWKGLRDLLKRIGNQWAARHNNSALGPDFAEGLFFDMMAICDAYIGA